MPFFAALHGGERFIADIFQRRAGRIGPRNLRGEIADDFPVRKKALSGFGVGELERAKEEVRGFDGVDQVGEPLS